MNPFASRAATTLYQHKWTDQNQQEPPETALDSPLLDLARTSDVDPLLPEQVADARAVLRTRRSLVETGQEDLVEEVLAGQRRVVERFLAGRRARFGSEQSQPLPDTPTLAREGRDIFVVIKFMDEAPHLDATLRSLLQQDVDPTRVVILAVDNNSTDGSDAIVKQTIERYRGPVRLVYLNQSTPGAGHAARLGVDTCIATVYAMCEHDGRWERLQTATIAVSDGDTVYHPSTLRTVSRLLEANPTVDGVMPFLTYKFTAALRLFRNFSWVPPAELARDDATAVLVPVDLSSVRGHAALPRQQRQLGSEGMRLQCADGTTVNVPLDQRDTHGRRYGIIQDSAGHLGYVFEDRSLILTEAPVSGVDTALTFLDNGGVQRDEKWRWHAVIGHDLFLHWAFRGMGLPEQMIHPDTSDALKTFRVWSFAIGGQHQLRRPDLRIATGSDYQSGRVLQAVGATSILGPADVFAETETDRLMKMVRNLVRQQAVFYGDTRAAALDRATGLYVHMTRIQQDIEAEILAYDDTLFEQIVFPERVLFPLRWILQNAIRFYAHGPQERQIVQERVLATMFGPAARAAIERDVLTPDALHSLEQARYDAKQTVAEQLAETVIAAHYPDIMDFYLRTLRDFFTAHQIAAPTYEWLLEGLRESRNALAEKRPPIDPRVVWSGDEFEIDTDRGQVLRIRKADS